MHAQKVFLVLLDISGYTRFIKLHKMSLIHAERIIDELLERVIAEAYPPLVLQGLKGTRSIFTRSQTVAERWRARPAISKARACRLQ